YWWGFRIRLASTPQSRSGSETKRRGRRNTCFGERRTRGVASLAYPSTEGAGLAGLFLLPWSDCHRSPTCRQDFASRTRRSDVASLLTLPLPRNPAGFAGLAVGTVDAMSQGMHDSVPPAPADPQSYEELLDFVKQV